MKNRQEIDLEKGVLEGLFEARSLLCKLTNETEDNW